MLGLEAVIAAFAALSGATAWRDDRLMREGELAEAEVVAMAERGTRTEVLYRLHLRGRVFWRASVFGQVARWARVPRAHVEDVRSRGRIQVRYLVEDPSVSMPAYASEAQRSLSQLAIGLGLIALMLPMGIAGSWLRVRREAESRGRAIHPMWRAERGPRTF